MRRLCIAILLILFYSCQKEFEEIHSPPDFMEIPKGFDMITFPETNTFSKARWELGKKLFFDPIMSIDSTISCASCHKPEFAFSDNQAYSKGVYDRPGTRNAPSIVNSAYHPYYTTEGGVPTLEMQILVPIQEHNEFDFNIVLLAERLSKNSEYISLTQNAYGRKPDAFTITRSIACFERSLISGFSPYDQYSNYNDPQALNESQIKGMNLFFSEKTQCSKCHGGFNFTRYEFANNGLYEQYLDHGRFRFTGIESDKALFKIPSLRNVSLTSPYMHDGSIANLKEVVKHYNNGGKQNLQKSSLIKPLNLSDEDIDNLVSFLESLTDNSFITNPIFQK